jgi:hypothetical protein
MSHCKEETSDLPRESALITDEDNVQCNPLYLLLITAVTIFTAEVLIMVFLWKLPLLGPILQAFVDASLLLLIVFPALYLFVLRPLRLQIRKRQSAEDEKDVLINELRQALNEVKTLQGIIPICAACKKIRDDQGYWRQVEAYVSNHSNALFFHGICPECVKVLYPEIANELNMNQEFRG